MKFTDLFIKRPVLASVVSLLILLVGLQAMLSLNVRQYPVSNSAVVTVTTVYTGASAADIQGFISTPLERAIASSDGIDYMTSSSTPNTSTITIYLRLNFDPNVALTQITTQINTVRSQLPPAALDPTINVQVGDSTAAMYLSFTSDDLATNQITDYLTRVVQPKLVSVPGVQSAQILGGRTFAMRIWLKANRMASLGVAPSDVYTALAANNALAALGATKGSMITVNINASTDLHTVDEFKNLVVKQQNGTIIRIRDVADVELGAQTYNSVVSFNGQNATFFGINVLPTANALTVIKDMRKILPAIEAQLPKGMHLTIPYDSTAYIQDSIHEVVTTLVEALLIVVVVIFLFLGSIRSVFIPVIAMPLSLVGTFFIMLAMGFSINLLTLLAMVLAIGLVVDDAIVIVENIHRHIEEGLSPFDAALKGAGELAGPVIAMTITLAAVYAPIGFVGGLTGSLFKEFAFTLAGAVIVSGIVALTLSPMLSSRILKHDTTKKGFAHWLDSIFGKLRARYESLLKGILNFKAVTIVFAILVLLSCIPFLHFAKNELAPDEDQGIIIAAGNAAPSANIDQTAAYGAQVIKVFGSFPEVQNIFQLAGVNGVNSVIAGMVLKPWSERSATTMDLLPKVTAKLGGIAGLQAAAFLRPPLPGGGSGPSVQFVIKSTDDPLHMYEVSNDLVGEAMKSGFFYYAVSDLKYDQPQVNVVVDRNKAADLGINMQQLSANIGAMLGGGYVNFFDIDGDSYQVIPQVERTQRLNPEQILDYQVPIGNGSLVPLSSIAKIDTTVEPQSLNHFQQLNSATISAVPAHGVTQGQALDWFNAQVKKVAPAGYQVDYASQSRQFKQEGSALFVTFGFAIIIVFLVLAAQFESFRDPLVVMFTVPLAISGALAFIFLGFASLNIYTEVGLITLVGLITKHGILIVQFANQLQEEGHDKRTAVEQACGVRLRPILMTTAAMVLGVLPLVFASGAGAVSRHDMGLVIATGMTIGTLFTLFVIPTAYLLIAPDLKKTKAPAADAHA